MSETFRGEFNQKVDSKARVSIPASFRRVIEAGDPSFSGGNRARFVLVYGGGAGRQFLECYTIEEMRRMERRIMKMPIGDKRRITLTRNLITLSQEVEIDEDGRIVLPPKGRSKIALDGTVLKDGSEATFAGMLTTFQIWKRDTYDAEVAGHAEIEEDILPEGEDMLSLLPDDPEE